MRRTGLRRQRFAAPGGHELTRMMIGLEPEDFNPAFYASSQNRESREMMLEPWLQERTYQHYNPGIMYPDELPGTSPDTGVTGVRNWSDYSDEQRDFMLDYSDEYDPPPRLAETNPNLIRSFPEPVEEPSECRGFGCYDVNRNMFSQPPQFALDSDDEFAFEFEANIASIESERAEQAAFERRRLDMDRYDRGLWNDSGININIPESNRPIPVPHPVRNAFNIYQYALDPTNTDTDLRVITTDPTLTYNEALESYLVRPDQVAMLNMEIGPGSPDYSSE